MINQNNSSIRKSAERLLARLVTKGSSREQGFAPAHSNAAQFADAEILIANDLAIRRIDGNLEITQAGRSHVARLQIARSGAEIDPFLGQHLDLAGQQVRTASGRAHVNVDTAESPLAWLARRKGPGGPRRSRPMPAKARQPAEKPRTRARKRSSSGRCRWPMRVKAQGAGPSAQPGPATSFRPAAASVTTPRRMR